MPKFSKILCVVDPTADAQPALTRAAWLAAHSGAQLDLLISYYNEYLSGDHLFDSQLLGKARDELLDGYRTRLEELATPLRNEGLAVETDAVWGHPLCDSIVQQALARDADVVFKETRYHSTLSLAFFTNTDWDLLRLCPVPLWLVSSAETRAKPAIIAAIDPLNEHDKPADLDDQILSLSKAIAAQVNGDVHAFHAFDPRLAIPREPARGNARASLPLDEMEQAVRKQHERRFKEVTEAHAIPRDRAHLVAGFTHEELPTLANDLNADLVVMGAVSRNRLKRLFIGATAERTLGRLPCDLLIVKPNWFETPLEVSATEAA